MQIEQLDAVRVQPPQAFVKLAFECYWPAVEHPFNAFVPMHAALRGDYQLVASISNGFCDQKLTFTILAVTVRRIEKVDPRIDRCGDGREAITLVNLNAGHTGNRPAAQGNGRNKQIGDAKSSPLARCRHRGVPIAARKAFSIAADGGLSPPCVVSSHRGVAYSQLPIALSEPH